MTEVTREKVLNDTINIVKDLTSDWDFDTEIAGETLLFNDLGFESIDAVALATALEEYCKRSLPFAEFLTQLGEKGIRDLSVGELADFVFQNLDGSSSFGKA